METLPTLQAARHFLSVVWDGEAPTDADLAEALDRLVMAYHSTPDAGGSDSDLEAPAQDSASLYEQVAQRFPGHGFYAIADPLEAVDQQMGMGDAIDDLADITNDMREVVWLAEHVGLDHAHWSFRLHFFHWGLHARELSLYLHARQW